MEQGDPTGIPSQEIHTTVASERTALAYFGGERIGIN